jgi:RNA polymerase sigma-70 factor (ECF subfamily)
VSLQYLAPLPNAASLSRLEECDGAGIETNGGACLEFESFFRDESRRLGTALYLIAGDPAEAEDLVQEAMARAYERWDRVGDMEAPAGYVYRVALNLHRRRQRRAGLQALLARPVASPSDPAEIAEAHVEALRALARLSPEQREAVVLVEWLGLSAEEAGGVLGIRPVSVRGRVYRARQTLGAMSEREGGRAHG